MNSEMNFCPRQETHPRREKNTLTLKPGSHLRKNRGFPLSNVCE